MSKVIITLTDTGELGVDCGMRVVGHSSGDDVEYTTAVLFGETIMRAISQKGMWGLAEALVPEMFPSPEEKIAKALAQAAPLVIDAASEAADKDTAELLSRKTL